MISVLSKKSSSTMGRTAFGVHDQQTRQLGNHHARQHMRFK